MNHADSPFLHGHDWAVAAWSILLIAIVLGLASIQTSQWLTSDSQFRDNSITTPAQEMATMAKLAMPHHDTFPAVLTIPFAVARAQRMMVARMKHRTDVSHRDEAPQSEGKSRPQLLTGLAILGASQSSNP